MSLLKTINVTAKGLVLLARPGTWLGFLSHPSLFFHNVLGLTKFIAANKDKSMMNDFFTWTRDHKRRYNLYADVMSKHGLKEGEFDYLEFGVCRGESMQWWIENNLNPATRFYGFDTFEGLPEDWGMAFKKGAMSADMPDFEDNRVHFIKGLFQDTLPGFLKSHPMDKGRKKVVHLDADLFSSTLYALSTLNEFLKPGDLVFFDEFNVPNHEYYALSIYQKTFYREFKLIGAVNNYYQTAFVVVK
ncbi:MAG: class I SAM-dependent methyltransferase [Bacteroidetes bacterium]|nr:class I SAM-dependent methyltransferase [Bacteroidota bacterium]